MGSFIIKSKKFGEHTVLYDDEDHDLIMKYTWGINKSKNNFYVVHSVNREGEKRHTIRLHKLVMGVSTRKPIVDHIDHNVLNNQKANLRKATYRQNGANVKVFKNNTSGFKGVRVINGKKWVSYVVNIRVNRKPIGGGTFYNILDAAKKYNELAIKYFGEFACLNKIPK